MSADGLIAPCENADGLVLLLHGVGASGASLGALAREIAVRFPKLAIRAPDAPHRFDGGRGRQWFSIQGVTEENRSARIEAAMSVFQSLLEREMRVHNVAPEQVILVGFSQGAIMALHHIVNGGPIGSVVALSGRLAHAPNENLDASPPIRLIHGEDDPIMPIETAERTAQWLKTANANFEFQRLPNLGHEVDARIVQRVLDFIAAQTEPLLMEGADRCP